MGLKAFCEYKFRIINFIIVIGTLLTAPNFMDYVYDKTVFTKSEYFTYYGTVITILSFLIAFFEILHTTTHTLSASAQISAEVKKLTHSKYLSSKSYVLTFLDNINDSIIRMEYAVALEKFRMIRRYISDNPELNTVCNEFTIQFNFVEKQLISYLPYVGKEEMPLRFRQPIQQLVLDLKRVIERENS